MEQKYSVMIVEKQEQMLHVIKNMLPWKDYGFHIASVTDNEDRALAYYGEYRYDLIFTAIDLKEGNGLSLIRQIKHLNPNSHIIVISRHDDYDTLRDAFKAGCNDYLLKNRLRYSTLAAILEDVKKALDKKNSHDVSPDNYELERLLGLIRDKQKVDFNSVYAILKSDEYKILRNHCRMLYFRMDNVKVFNRNLKQYDKPAWMSTEEFIDMFQNKLVLRDEMQVKLKMIITKLFSDISESKLIFTKKHSGLILVPNMDIERIIKKANDLIEQIRLVLSYEFSVTISLNMSELSDFLPMYEAMMLYHNHKFYDGDSCVQNMEDHKQLNRLKRNLLSYNEKMCILLETQKFNEVVPLGKEIIYYMKKHYIDPEDVKQYFCEMMDMIECMLIDKNIEEIYPFDVLRQGIQDSESIMYLDLEIEKILKTLMDWMIEHVVSKYKKKVVSIIEFVDEHIHQKISLQMIADEVGLSEIYTSRVFKKETGKSLVTYINEEKMKKAEELLKNEKLKIKDVAHQVGIDDQLYFNKIFKKIYQLSPREYRKKL